MAKNVLRRFIQIIFDRPSAKKAEGELAASMGTAGKKGGENFLRELRAAFTKRMADLKNQLAKGLIDPKQFKAQADLAAKQFNTGILAGMEKARAAGKLTETEYLKLSRTLKKTGDERVSAWDRIKASIVRLGAALAVTFGVRAAIRFGAESIREWIESEKVFRELAGTVDAAGVSFAGLEKRVRAAATAFQEATVHSDEDYARSLQRLIALTGNVEGSIQNMTVAADFAARFFGGDLAAATEAVARGMNTGTVLINRMRFSFEELKKRALGGTIEATQTLSGKLKQLNNQWSEFKEQIGGVLVGSRDTVGVLSLLTTSVKSMVKWVGDNREALQQWVTEGVNAAIGGLRTLLGLARDWLQLQGQLSFTVGTEPFQPAKTAKGIEAQMKVLSAQRKQLVKEQADALKALDKAQKAWTLFGVSSPKILDLGQNLASVNSQLDKVDANAARAKVALKAMGETLPSVKGRPTEPSKDAKERGKELEKIERDIAVARLQISEGLTEALARDAVHRNELLHPQAERTTATFAELEAAWKKLDELRTAADVLATEGPDRLSQSLADVGVKAGSAIPAIQAMNEELFVQLKLLEAMAPAGSKLAEEIARVAREQWKAANAAEGLNSKWVDALQSIKLQLVDSISGIGQAWVERGDSKERRQEIVKALKDENLSVERRIELEKELGDLSTPWLIKFAKAKIKENIAAALEMAAKALGFLVFGFGPQAGQAAASAAGHVAAAAAWRVVAGGGGSSGGASSTGGVGSSAPNTSRTSNMQAPGPEVHIHFKGPSVFDPEFQHSISFAVNQAHERFGQNIKVNIHRER